LAAFVGLPAFLGPVAISELRHEIWNIGAANTKKARHLGTKKGVPFGIQNCVGTKLSRYGF